MKTNLPIRDTMPEMLPSFSTAKRVVLATLILCLLSAEGYGQRPTPTASPAQSPASTSRPDALWRCELPGGVYLVALRSVVSISSHEYTVDGLARVTEVTVATASTVEARFYFLEPMTPNGSSAVNTTLDVLQQRVQDLSASHPGVEAVWQKVVKNYPTTTHAHTVEYRLGSKADLQSLYSSLEQSWTTGKGANFKAE